MERLLALSSLCDLVFTDNNFDQVQCSKNKDFQSFIKTTLHTQPLELILDLMIKI